MENKKSVLITIVVLLIIFVPLTIIGLLNNNNIGFAEENPNHETFYNGYMYFYNSNDEFLSKYECLTEICDYTVPTIDDDVYNINYYKDGTINKVPLMSDAYTFLTDGAVIYLYSANTGTTLQTYKAIKTYNTNLTDNKFIIQNSEGLWGVLSIASSMSPVLPFEYDFIGLINDLNDEGVLKADKFIVLKDNKWYIVNSENSALTGYIDDPIIDYTEEYVFSKKEDKIRIYSFKNYEYLTDYTIKDYILIDKYIGIITDTSILIYENLGTPYLKSYELTNNTDKIDLEINENKLNIKINDTVVDSVELS